jgi:hypothetical protein
LASDCEQHITDARIDRMSENIVIPPQKRSPRGRTEALTLAAEKTPPKGAGYVLRRGSVR